MANQNAQKNKSYKINNLWKARSRIRILAASNFKEGDKFLTLTFNNDNNFDINDIPACNDKYTLFIRRLAREFKGLKYITVLEFQKRGAVHYHILCNIPYIEKEKLAEIWGHGFIFINEVQAANHIIRYISKYMAKYAEDKRFEKHRRYFCSTKLLRPIKLDRDESLEILKMIRKENPPAVSWNRYFSSYCGLIATEVYNLENLPAPKDQQ